MTELIQVFVGISMVILALSASALAFVMAYKVLNDQGE